MLSEGHVYMRDCVTWGVAPICRGGIESSHRFITPVHARVGDSQTKRWSATEILSPFVKSDRVVESPHLAIQCRQQWLAIDKRRVQLQSAFAGSDRFIIETEVTVEFARGIVHPQRSRIDFGSALQISERLIAFAARGPKRSRKII